MCIIVHDQPSLCPVMTQPARKNGKYKKMLPASQNIKGTKVGVLGLTSGQDSKDLNNPRVEDLIQGLQAYNCCIQAHDPIADPKDAVTYYNVELIPWENLTDLDALILAVPHSWYKEQPIEAFTQKLNAKGCLIDVNGILDPKEVKKFCVRFWQGSDTEKK